MPEIRTAESEVFC